MSQYFESLIDAAFGRPTAIQPRPISRFEGDAGARHGDWSPLEQEKLSQPPEAVARDRPGATDPSVAASEPRDPLLARAAHEAEGQPRSEQGDAAPLEAHVRETTDRAVEREIHRVERIEHIEREIRYELSSEPSPSVIWNANADRLSAGSPPESSAPPNEQQPLSVVALAEPRLADRVEPVRDVAHAPASIAPFALSTPEVAHVPMEATPEAEPHIVVSIGRLDIRIGGEPARPMPRARPTQAGPSLADYLSGRSGGRR